MNSINRPLVKSQAKQIIKEKMFALFLVSFVVLLLVNGISAGVNYYANESSFDTSDFSSDYDDNDYYNNDSDDLEDFFNGGGSYSNGNGSYSSSDNPIENFGKSNNGSTSGSNMSSSLNGSSLLSKLASYDFGFNFASVISIVLSPLFVTLLGFYVIMINRNPDDELTIPGAFKEVFSNSFNGTYGKKLIVYILRKLFTFLWAILLVFPGIIYHYSSYFACQLMCENPNLKPTEALKLSKKMVNGHRGELFAFDLSFIGWFLLSVITFGIASIYVLPYYFTSQAIYYENFKARAFREGKIYPDDFLSAEEKAVKYGYNNNTQQNNYYSPNSQPQSDYYYNPQGAENTQDTENAQNAEDSQSAQDENAYTGNAEPFAEGNIPQEKPPVQSGEYDASTPYTPPAESQTETAQPEQPGQSSEQSEQPEQSYAAPTQDFDDNQNAEAQPMDNSEAKSTPLQEQQEQE